jgi:opacity protein-like surface antigen
MRTIVPGVRTLVLIVTLAVATTSSHSQSITTGNGKYEFGLAFGPLFFLGDLGGNYGVGTDFVKDVQFPLTKISKGIYANIYPSEWIGFRVAINQGRLEGYDNKTKSRGRGYPEHYRKERNLQFTSNMFEAYAAVEIYPTVFFEQYDGLQGKLRPYGVVGIGAFKFNPKGEYISPTGARQWVELKPLRLEGQGMAEYPDRKEYSLISMSIPVGAGAKYYIKDNFYVGLEVMHRKSFTDYVDDVSTTYIDAINFPKYLTPQQVAMANQLYYRENLITPGTRPFRNEQRGDATDNDSFFSTTLRFGWRLNDWNSPNGRARRQMRCPNYY